MNDSLEIVILAAGRGKRMNRQTPKVLSMLAGRPSIVHVLDAVARLNPCKIHIVVSGIEIQNHLQQNSYLLEKVSFCIQQKPLGTADALLSSLPFIKTNSNVLCICGDMPLVLSKTYLNLIEAHNRQSTKEAISLLTSKISRPYGYGRIVRDSQGKIEKIVEQSDLSDDMESVNEINTGVMLARRAIWEKLLQNRFQRDNNQSEYYLTDCIQMAKEIGYAVVTCNTSQEEEAFGFNTLIQLHTLEKIIMLRRSEELIAQGVWIGDKHRLDIRGNVSAGEGVSIDINTLFEGEVVLGDDVKVGPNCVLMDAIIGNRTQIKPFSLIENCSVGEDCNVGPFARLRPMCKIDDEVSVGNFVEVKKSKIGKHTKINHLSYVGDSVIGKSVNVGAGVITCNYDGVNKHSTVIEDGAFIGSGSQLVAPVKIGSKSTIGAGSTITKDTKEDVLTLARNRQVSIDKWQGPKNK